MIVGRAACRFKSHPHFFDYLLCRIAAAPALIDKKWVGLL